MKYDRQYWMLKYFKSQCRLKILQAKHNVTNGINTEENSRKIMFQEKKLREYSKEIRSKYGSRENDLQKRH